MLRAVMPLLMIYSWVICAVQTGCWTRVQREAAALCACWLPERDEVHTSEFERELWARKQSALGSSFGNYHRQSAAAVSSAARHNEHLALEYNA